MVWASVALLVQLGLPRILRGKAFAAVGGTLVALSFVGGFEMRATSASEALGDQRALAELMKLAPQVKKGTVFLFLLDEPEPLLEHPLLGVPRYLVVALDLRAKPVVDRVRHIDQTVDPLLDPASGHELNPCCCAGSAP